MLFSKRKNTLNFRQGHFILSEHRKTDLKHRNYFPTLARIIFNAPPALNHSTCWSL
jgi:hypothetical protein